MLSPHSCKWLPHALSLWPTTTPLQKDKFHLISRQSFHSHVLNSTFFLLLNVSAALQLFSDMQKVNLMQDKGNMEAETLARRSGEKSQVKAPKKVHKAEREKMKREHLNELFLDLANSVGLSEQPNGKASVLTDATRMIKEMVSQIESLRKDNAALTSEAEEVAAEKNELQDETSVLGSQIAELQNELEKRINESRINLNAALVEMHHHEFAPGTMNEPFQQPGPESTLQGHNMKAFYVIPLCSAPGIHPDPGTLHDPESIVRKPQARYPSPRDAWPSQILEKHPESG